MSGRKNRSGVDGETETTLEADDVSEEVTNPLEVEADDDDAEEYQFDAALLASAPQGAKLVDLAPDFVRPEGFLITGLGAAGGLADGGK